MTITPIKEKDYLEQDPPLRGQSYFLASFISPDDIINETNVFVFSKFLGSFAQEMNTLFNNMKIWAKDHNCFNETNMMLESVKNRHDYLFNENALQSEYNLFKSKNEINLANEYSAKNEDRTNVRGLKVRGVFSTLEEANAYSKKLQSQFPKHPPTFTGEVGCWAPWSPHQDDVQHVEYYGDVLNTMMQKYNDQRDEEEKEHFRKYVESRKQLTEGEKQINDHLASTSIQS